MAPRPRPAVVADAPKQDDTPSAPTPPGPSHRRDSYFEGYAVTDPACELEWPSTSVPLHEQTGTPHHQEQTLDIPSYRPDWPLTSVPLGEPAGTLHPQESPTRGQTLTVPPFEPAWASTPVPSRTLTPLASAGPGPGLGPPSPSVSFSQTTTSRPVSLHNDRPSPSIEFSLPPRLARARPRSAYSTRPRQPATAPSQPPSPSQPQPQPQPQSQPPQRTTSAEEAVAEQSFGTFGSFSDNFKKSAPRPVSGIDPFDTSHAAAAAPASTPKPNKRFTWSKRPASAIIDPLGPPGDSSAAAGAPAAPAVPRRPPLATLLRPASASSSVYADAASSTISVPTLGVGALSKNRHSLPPNWVRSMSFGGDGMGEARRKLANQRRASGSFSKRRSLTGFQEYVDRRRSVVANDPLYRYRSKSTSSVLFYMQKDPAKVPTLPFLDTEAHPDLVQKFMDMAKVSEDGWKRSNLQTWVFRGAWYLGLVCVLYFGAIGLPLWEGLVVALWHYVKHASFINLGFLIFLSWGTSICWIPLLLTDFEQEVDDVEGRDTSDVCLIIPAYKAEGALGETIRHALKIFKPYNVLIVANGNSPTPLDDTETVCNQYGVRHLWVPVGSKITAEFVGVIVAKEFKYAMLIDDDVHLPANLPIVTDRFDDVTACMGYTIKSTGADGCRGTMIQQCQDVEYKLSGLSRVFAGKFGSATFPHGAIILWDRQVLEDLFWSHPGYHISEDWYFGHVCRSIGKRIKFCSQVFVETETPPSLFIPAKSTRGGYGEMTIFKQRFYRWNFFHIYRIYDDMVYILFAWRLGWLELVTKVWVFVEVYSSFLYLLRPIMWPMALAVNAKLCFGLMFALTGIYALAFVTFNAWHLRRKNEMVQWKVMPFYFGMKLCLLFTDTASVYYALYAYAKFFAIKHPRVTQNFQALNAAQDLLRETRAKSVASTPVSSLFPESVQGSVAPAQPPLRDSVTGDDESVFAEKTESSASPPMQAIHAMQDARPIV